jgi:hypothetical protein
MTQDEIYEMARDADWGHASANLYAPALERFAKLVAEREREACAKIVENSPSYDWHKFACEAAYAIRARGEQT